ncbi:MAG: hypothetical protein L3J91_06420, partial [Thermoplasmata archaeon]|nr:hypothetical protein [Thermoplasmata archaeon]
MAALFLLSGVSAGIGSTPDHSSAARPTQPLGTDSARTPSGGHATQVGGSPISRDAHVLGPRPQSWHGRTVPPGAPVPRGGAPGAQGVRSARAQPSTINNSDLNRFCFGVWPASGNQSEYLNGCYGHDEPGINPYSSQPGSAGNVTWTVTLPTDRSPTQNQSDLYTAIWFGMVLTDPFAWMDECFLELQFYPDSSWTGGPAVGNWIGAAVAWQIEAATGYENTSFYQVLGENP